jgi:hypothetical protein
MYAWGYSHANCGGGCCKQGVGDWLITRQRRSDLFYGRAEWEAMMQQRLDVSYAHCRDQRGGTVTPITLYEIDQREAELSQRQASLFNCVNCGAGDLLMMGER